MDNNSKNNILEDDYLADAIKRCRFEKDELGNYDSSDAYYACNYCSICGGKIKTGQKYVYDEIGGYAHYKCLKTPDDLINWMKLDVEDLLIYLDMYVETEDRPKRE